MERSLTPEEKIKRAEDIYYRRRNQYTRNNVATVNVSESRNYGLFKKMILQIIICLLIYFIFYLIQTSNYIFSEDVINKTKEILSYDINLPNMYNQAIEYINSNWSITSDENNNMQENIVENEQIQNIVEENTIDTVNAIGGGDINEIQVENTQQEVTEEPKTDEEYIKANFSFIKPVEGTVSSEFGIRNVDNPIVSKNHYGIDIVANTGTVINAAMEGKVTISSTVGSYGYHIKIENNDVATLYAHCSKLYVNVGDTVTQGQPIAEVGSTGNSIGPHLHFEIMRGTTYINPRNILEF